MNPARWPGILAQAIWIAHAGVHAVLAVGALYLGAAFPAFAALPLLAATVLFAAVYARRNGRLVVRTLLAAGAQLALGSLLLGGPGTTLTIGERAWRDLPALPGLLQVPAWAVGLLLPAATTVYALRQIRRGERRRILPGPA